MENEKNQCARYSLIIEDLKGNKYCYNNNLKRFVLIYNDKDETKCTLPLIDSLTCIFENSKSFAESYGIVEGIKNVYIKYQHNGERYLAVAFNNKLWNKIARSYHGEKVDFTNSDCATALTRVYLGLIDEESNFSKYIMDPNNRNVRISQKLRNELVSLLAHEGACRSNIRYGMADREGNKQIYINDRNGFYHDLKNRLESYRELRAMYLNLCYYNSFEEKKESVISKPDIKKKVLIPPQQMSMFDL